MCRRANKAGRCKTDKLHILHLLQALRWSDRGRGMWEEPKDTDKLHAGLTGDRAMEKPTYTTSVTSFTLVRQGQGVCDEPKDTDKLHVGLTGDGVCGTSQRILTSFTLV